MKRSFPLYVVCLAFLGVPGCSRGPRALVPTPVPIDTALAVATFDSAWARIGATYYDTTFHGLDWAQVRSSLRPKAARARNMGELRATIESLFVRLGGSHFALIPGDVAASWSDGTSSDSAEPGELGIEVRLVEGKALISRVEPHSAASNAGIPAGWIVERVGSLEVFPLIEALQRVTGETERRSAEVRLPLRIMAATLGGAGSRVRLTLRDGEGRRSELDLARTASDGEEVRFGRLPPQLVRFESSRLDDAGGCVGVIRFNVWMVPVMKRLDQAMVDLRRCRGIVIDLRGNVGGVAALVMGISGFFLDTAVSLGTMRSRGVRLNYVANPRRADPSGAAVTPYAGPLAILVDGLSVSTSEIFAAGLQTLGRARLFGEGTAGEALPAMLAILPNRDVMQHVVADFTDPNGRRIEARGVVPDVLVPLRRVDLLASRDGALAAAKRWIDESAGHLRAGATARF